MIPPKGNLVDIALKMFLTEIMKNSMFYTLKFSVERFRRIVVNAISCKFLLLMVDV